MFSDFDLLKKKFVNCCLCDELACSRSRVVFGSVYKEGCKIMIIGEAPGKVEDERGVPFVGKSGEILNMFLSEIGLRRKDVFITNTVLCRPPKNRNPKSDELKNCRERLDEVIKIVKPEVIVTLGNFSTQYMLETKEGINKLRGKVYEKEGVKILPMLHPAALMYGGMNEGLMAKYRNDFKLLNDVLLS
tara:strand:+ start:83 stop:649 length:567 start_codon:yes stop_codon:yes gene_type:complete